MTALSALRFISGLAAGVIAGEAAADIQTPDEQPGRQHNGHGYQAPRKAPRSRQAAALHSPNTISTQCRTQMR